MAAELRFAAIHISAGANVTIRRLEDAAGKKRQPKKLAILSRTISTFGV